MQSDGLVEIEALRKNGAEAASQLRPVFRQPPFLVLACMETDCIHLAPRFAASRLHISQKPFDSQPTASSTNTGKRHTRHSSLRRLPDFLLRPGIAQLQNDVLLGCFLTYLAGFLCQNQQQSPLSLIC